MMNKQALVLVYAVAFGAGAEADTIDRYRTDSGAECSTSFDSPHSIEMGLRGDTSISSDGLSIEPFITYKYTFNTKPRPRIDCQKTRRLQEERMMLENEILRMELEALKKQAAEEEKNSNTISDEW